MPNTLSYDSFPDAVAAAKAAWKRGDLKEAAAIYRQLPEAYPNKKNAVTIAAEGLNQCGFWTDGVAVLQSALQKVSVSASYLSALAEMYRTIGDYPRAASYIQRYLDYDSRDPEAWLHLARLHDLAGNYVLAEAAYANALERAPMSALAAIGRGDSLFHLGRLEDAITCYRRAVAIEPKDANSLFALGSALITSGAQTEGHAYLMQALEIDPGNARAHVNLGLAYFNTGNAQNAVISARNALLIDQNLEIAHVLLGLALAEQADIEAAGAALHVATAGDTHNVEALYALASVEVARDDKTAAEIALQRVLSHSPEDKEARHLLSALHGAAISRPIEGYSQEAFDRRAPLYDNQEVRFRDYSVPAELVTLIEEHEPDRRVISRLADLGCGTGLVAAAIHDAFRVEQTIGIDVSPNMAKIASAKSLYDRIIVGDAENSLLQLEGKFDVICAGDLFPYVGDIETLLQTVHSRLVGGGILAYSIELSETNKMKLAPDGRFTHTDAYMAEVASRAGLRQVASRPITLRRIYGRAVPGLVGILSA